MNQLRGLADSIVAQCAGCADFCNTICHKQTSVAHQIFGAGREGWPERTASCQGKIGLDYGMRRSDQIIPNWRKGADYRAAPTTPPLSPMK